MNLYVTPYELKATLEITTTTYDDLLLRNAELASEYIDKAAGWRFYPYLRTRYFDVDDDDPSLVKDGTLYLPEPLLAITSISISNDDGATYTALAATDYYTARGGNYEAYPWTEIILAANGDYSSWYTGQRAVKIIGTWGYREEYATEGWVLSGDTVIDNPLTAGATTLTVADTYGLDDRGLTPRFQTGQLLKLESEIVYVRAVASNTALAIQRAQNGSTAASHVATTPIYIWRPQELAANCARIQAARWFKRAQQAFQDVSAAIEMGQLTYAQELDPDIRSMLKAGLMRLV